MTSADDLRFAAQQGPKAFKQKHGSLTAPEKLAAAREERALVAHRAAELRTARRDEVLHSGYIASEEIRQASTECERDVEDFDAVIAELEKQIAAEEAAEESAAEEAAAAAEAQHQAERKGGRTKASVKFDEALSQVEAAYAAWVESQSDLPVVQQNRRSFYLRCALHKLAPKLAIALDVQRVPHNHQRALAEVVQ